MSHLHLGGASIRDRESITTCLMQFSSSLPGRVNEFVRVARNDIPIAVLLIATIVFLTSLVLLLTRSCWEKAHEHEEVRHAAGQVKLAEKRDIRGLEMPRLTRARSKGSSDELRSSRTGSLDAGTPKPAKKTKAKAKSKSKKAD